MELQWLVVWWGADPWGGARHRTASSDIVLTEDEVGRKLTKPKHGEEPGWVSELAGVSSHTPKDYGFDPWFTPMFLSLPSSLSKINKYILG